jgi:tetratricopeptide (TPR) repeat protein
VADRGSANGTLPVPANDALPAGAHPGYRGAMANTPIDADTYELYQRGRELLAARHAHQAVTVLERAQAIAPGFGSIDELLGRAYYATRRFDAARSAFVRALERHPANDYAHFALALTLLKLGERDLGVGHLRMALAMRPGSTAYATALARATADG